MRLFSKKVREDFDLVIYDTPPVTGQSDTYLIAEHTDGLWRVAQPGRLKQSALNQAMEQLQIADVNVIGLAIRES